MISSSLRPLGELYTPTHEQRLLALRVTIRIFNVQKCVIYLIIFWSLHPNQVVRDDPESFAKNGIYIFKNFIKFQIEFKGSFELIIENIFMDIPTTNSCYRRNVVFLMYLPDFKVFKALSWDIENWTQASFCSLGDLLM